MSTSLTILSVKLASENGHRVLGVAYAEPSSNTLGVAEFIENDLFSNLEVIILESELRSLLPYFFFKKNNNIDLGSAIET